MKNSPRWWRSSILGEIDRHCLAVIHPDFAGMVDRRIFGAGTVAHDIYNRVQLATNKAGEELGPLEVEQIARGAIERGAAEGREFEKDPEPPLRPGAYLDGKQLATDWLAARPAQPGRETEIGITIDRWGMTVDKDSPKRWMRGILDLLWIDEDGIAVVPDIKTDYPSEESALHSAQRRIQMMEAFAWANAKGHRLAGIRPEIWNFRRFKIYPREEDREQFTLTAESIGILDEWREDLLALTDGYDKALAAKTAEELASPGFGCQRGEGGCPALSKCKAGQAWVAKRGLVDVEAAVIQQPVLRAETERLRDILEPAANDLGTIRVAGTECGFEQKPGFEVRDDAILELWREFRGDQIANPIDCICQGKEPECLMCSGVGKSIDWERELNRQRALLVTFLSAIRPIGSDTFRKKILPKLWPLVRVSKDEKAANKQTRALVSERLLEPVKRPKWFVRKAPAPAAPGESLIEKIEASIAIEKEKKRFKEPK